MKRTFLFGYSIFKIFKFCFVIGKSLGRNIRLLVSPIFQVLHFALKFSNMLKINSIITEIDCQRSFKVMFIAKSDQRSRGAQTLQTITVKAQCQNNAQKLEDPSLRSFKVISELKMFQE